LAILTAEKVLPQWDLVWEQTPFFDHFCTAEELIETSKQLLRKSISFREALAILIDFNTGQNIYAWVTYEVDYAFNAAYYALELLVVGTTTLLEPFDEGKVDESGSDFAEKAVRAYTAVDCNDPGKWFECFGPNPENVTPIVFNWERRLEFWEWWLSEAIPQAWQLTQENSDS
jgi:hypothetical protein